VKKGTVVRTVLHDAQGAGPPGAVRRADEPGAAWVLEADVLLLLHPEGGGRFSWR